MKVWYPASHGTKNMHRMSKGVKVVMWNYAMLYVQIWSEDQPQYWGRDTIQARHIIRVPNMCMYTLLILEFNIDSCTTLVLTPIVGCDHEKHGWLYTNNVSIPLHGLNVNSRDAKPRGGSICLWITQMIKQSKSMVVQFGTSCSSGNYTSQCTWRTTIMAFAWV